jgi:hypothetical protein
MVLELQKGHINWHISAFEVSIYIDIYFDVSIYIEEILILILRI